MFFFFVFKLFTKKILSHLYFITDLVKLFEQKKNKIKQIVMSDVDVGDVEEYVVGVDDVDDVDNV